MLIPFLISKIHRAKVTATDINYEGSIAIDEAILEKANLRVFQKVEIYNVNNGNRLSTYTIPLPRGCRQIVINGAAAHLVSAGDIVIIAAYALIDEKELNSRHAMILNMNDDNEIVKVTSGNL
jgi:aspartate 1-decarboxylase